MTTNIQGIVQNTRGQNLPDVDLIFSKQDTGKTEHIKTGGDGRFSVALTPGRYRWIVFEEGYKLQDKEVDVPDSNSHAVDPINLEEENVEGSLPGSISGSMPGSMPDDQEPLDELSRILQGKQFNIEPQISEEEANQAITLFRVVNIMLAGLGQRVVGSTESIDILGMLNLFYGLQDKTLSDRLVLQNSEFLWNNIETDISRRAKDLDQLQNDVDFLGREAKRQFNLGMSNTVLGNTQFPVLFNRYVEIANDPMISIDIEVQKTNPFFDKARLEETFDLLADLKSTAIQIVRSLSKHGTIATSRVNKDWSEFEAGALKILGEVGEQRAVEDPDEKMAWEVLAVLIGRRREEIIPYIALAKHGTELLKLAFKVYEKSKDILDEFDRDILKDLFQPTGAQDEEYLSSKIRRAAGYIKRYPLQNWG